MRKSVLVVSVVLFSMSIFSCTTSDIVNEVGIEELTTEGEDEEILPEEEDGN